MAAPHELIHAAELVDAPPRPAPRSNQIPARLAHGRGTRPRIDHIDGTPTDARGMATTWSSSPDPRRRMGEGQPTVVVTPPTVVVTPPTAVTPISPRGTLPHPGRATVTMCPETISRTDDAWPWRGPPPSASSPIPRTCRSAANSFPRSARTVRFGAGAVRRLPAGEPRAGTSPTKRWSTTEPGAVLPQEAQLGTTFAAPAGDRTVISPTAVAIISTGAGGAARSRASLYPVHTRWRPTRPCPPSPTRHSPAATSKHTWDGHAETSGRARPSPQGGDNSGPDCHPEPADR